MKTKLMMAAALLLVCAACKKDKEEPQDPEPGNFVLSFGYHWMDDELDTANTYADGAGHAIKFTAVKFFMGAMHLENGGNEVAHYHDHHALAIPGEDQVVTYGAVSPGAYDMLEADLGLDSLDNHSDPASAGPPLNDTTMHWGPGTANGYYFLVLEGRVDDDGTGIVEADDPTFTYRCATDDALREVALPISATVATGNGLALHIHIRTNLIVAGVDMLATPSATGYQAINQQLMDNLAGALDVE